MDFIDTQTGEMIELTTEMDVMNHAATYNIQLQDIPNTIASYVLPTF